MTKNSDFFQYNPVDCKPERFRNFQTWPDAEKPIPHKRQEVTKLILIFGNSNLAFAAVSRQVLAADFNEKPDVHPEARTTVRSQ